MERNADSAHLSVRARRRVFTQRSHLLPHYSNDFDNILTFPHRQYFLPNAFGGLFHNQLLAELD